MAGPGLEERLERFAAHLRAHLQEVLPDRAANLDQQVDAATGLDQSVPVPLFDQLHLAIGKAEALHVSALVGLEGLPIGFLGERHRELVDAVAAPRSFAGKYSRARDRSVAIGRLIHAFSSRAVLISDIAERSTSHASNSPTKGSTLARRFETRTPRHSAFLQRGPGRNPAATHLAVSASCVNNIPNPVQTWTRKLGGPHEDVRPFCGCLFGGTVRNPRRKCANLRRCL